MKWVTLKRVKMDRTVSGWLILRFLDPEAEFEFVEKDDVQAALDAGAKPFHTYAHVPGVRREHSGFQELLMEHGLDKTDPALVLLGETVRAAERAGWSKDGSENYGLWAIINGFSVLANGDDLKVIESMLPVYDALYEYCKQRAAGEAGWKSDT
jgi:hypothetical protein